MFGDFLRRLRISSPTRIKVAVERTESTTPIAIFTPVDKLRDEPWLGAEVVIVVAVGKKVEGLIVEEDIGIKLLEVERDWDDFCAGEISVLIVLE